MNKIVTPPPPQALASMARATATPFVSVVIPMYNEESVLEALFQRMTCVMAGLGLPYELIFVNDGSRDKTLAGLVLLAKRHPEVKVIDLSRNFGHQVAVTAGIDHAQGDVVILIDADLQDPPELIRDFLDKWRQGYDVVYAVRRQREGESWFKRWTAERFYRVLNHLSEVKIPVDTGDFRLMNRNVVDSLMSVTERHRFIRGLVSWVGFKQIGIPYERERRYAGESKYPLKKMLKFAADGITGFSTKPLRWALKAGVLVGLAGFIGILLSLYLRIFTNVTVQGWTSLMVVSLFLGGVQLIILGIMGEYIGRIYDEVRGRPLYLIKDLFNLPGDSSRNS